MRTPLLASFLLAFLFTACAVPTAVLPTATLTPMTPSATLEPSPTATQSAPTEPAPTPTPDTLFPPDFAVANVQELGAAIEPYCYVRRGLADDALARNKEIVKPTELWQELFKQAQAGKIANATIAWWTTVDGGKCAQIWVQDKPDKLITRAFFEIAPNVWKELVFTNPTTEY